MYPASVVGCVLGGRADMEAASALRQSFEAVGVKLRQGLSAYVAVAVSLGAMLADRSLYKPGRPGLSFLVDNNYLGRSHRAHRALPRAGFAAALASPDENTPTPPSRQAAPGRGDLCGDEERSAGVGARSALPI